MTIGDWSLIDKFSGNVLRIRQIKLQFARHCPQLPAASVVSGLCVPSVTFRLYDPPSAYKESVAMSMCFGSDNPLPSPRLATHGRSFRSSFEFVSGFI